MNDRQLDSLRYTLWAELQLPELPVFTLERGKIRSQTYRQTGGFMAKFVESYDITIVAHPEPHPSLFDAGCSISVNYQHGKWERGGSNGVSTNLYHAVKQQQWVDEETARAMYAADTQHEGA